MEEILWREIREAHMNAKVPLGGHLTKTKLDLQTKTSGRKHFAYGFATKPDTASEEATKIQGYHNTWVLVVFDEAPGILTPIWRSAEGLIVNERCKFLAIGNPTKAKAVY